MCTLAKSNDNHLIWVDLEMTGLDVTKCYILEMACVITDAELNIVAESPDLVIHYVCINCETKKQFRKR
jgi:oligoribonuclease